MHRSARFVVDLPARCPPDEALRRALDLGAHSRLIPLTTVTPAVSADELVTGFTFVGRTALGKVGFDDPMWISSLSFAPVAHARIHKRGRIIRGDVAISATATRAGSRLRWEQRVHLPWLPGFLQAPAAAVLHAAYRRVLVRLLA